MKLLEFCFKGELHFFVTDELSAESLASIRQLFTKECEGLEGVNNDILVWRTREKLGITLTPLKIDYVIAI